MTKEQIEKAAQQHADELRVSASIPGTLVPMLHDIAKSSYICGAQDTLASQWISAKCLSDFANEDNFASNEPKPAGPKFKLGDKVVVKQGTRNSEIATIVYYCANDNSYRVEYLNDEVTGSLWFSESDLGAYTEPQPETQKKAKVNETAFASDAQNMDENIMLRAWCEYRGMEYVEGHVRPLPSDNFEKGFRMAVDKFMALPLEQKLTAEERSYIKKLYMAADVSSTDFGRGYKAAINRKFGADLCHNKSNSNESMD